MMEAVQVVVGSIVIVDVMICCALLHCVLEAAQMNMQSCQLQEFMSFNWVTTLWKQPKTMSLFST